MAAPDSVGQFEQLVLTAILSLHKNAYAVTIHSKVQELAQPNGVALGAIYVTLASASYGPASRGQRAGDMVEAAGRTG